MHKLIELIQRTSYVAAPYINYFNLLKNKILNLDVVNPDRKVAGAHGTYTSKGILSLSSLEEQPKIYQELLIKSNNKFKEMDGRKRDQEFQMVLKQLQQFQLDFLPTRKENCKL